MTTEQPETITPRRRKPRPKGRRGLFGVAMSSVDAIAGRIAGDRAPPPDDGAPRLRTWTLHLTPEDGSEVTVEVQRVGLTKARLKLVVAADVVKDRARRKSWSLENGAFGTPVMREVAGWVLPALGLATDDPKAKQATWAALVADIAVRDATMEGGPLILELDLMAAQTMRAQDVAHRLGHWALDRAENDLTFVPDSLVRLGRRVNDLWVAPSGRKTLARRPVG